MSAEIKSLIVGEAASPALQSDLMAIVEADCGPHDGVSAKTVEDVTARLQRAIKSSHPEVRHLFIEVQSEAAFAANATAPVATH